MADHYSLDVVIPCYNEEDNLPHTIPVLNDFLTALVSREDLALARFRMILVDDGSSDRSRELLAGLAGVRPVLHPENKRFLYGAAR